MASPGAVGTMRTLAGPGDGVSLVWGRVSFNGTDGWKCGLVEPGGLELKEEDDAGTSTGVKMVNGKPGGVELKAEDGGTSTC